MRTTQDMPKAKKKRVNRPMTFKETLAPAMPLAPSTTGLTASHMRVLGLMAWVALTIALGVTIGMLVARPASTPAAAERPLPIATTTIKPVAAADATISQTAQPNATLNGQVVTPTAVTQAGAGNPLAVASGSFYQPAANSEAMQPGFSAYTNAQGTQGTAPVK